MIKSILFNVAMRSAGLLSSVILVISVSFLLSERDQGIYYFLQSLVALNFFFDLGIGYVLSNLAGASKSRTFARIDSLSILEMNDLKAVISFGLNWIFASSTLYFIIVSVSGYFSLLNHMQMNSDNIILWIVLIFSNASNLILTNILSITEGFGFSQRAAACRFIQASINSIVFFILVYIYKNPFFISFSFLISIIFCYLLFYFLFKKEIFYTYSWKTKSEISWRRNIFPFQWRIAISWLTGYFMFQAPTLALSLSGKIEDAGHLGLSLQIYFALLSICQIYLILCVPRWTSNIKNGNPITKDFFTACFITCLFFIVISFWMPLISFFYPDFFVSKRLIETYDLAFILIGTLGFLIFICGNFYFRAHLEERLWGISIIGALLMAGGMFAFRNSLSSAWISLLFCGIGLLLGCLAVLLVLSSSRRSSC